MKNKLLITWIFLTSLTSLQAQAEYPSSAFSRNRAMVDSVRIGNITIGYEHALAKYQRLTINQTRTVPLKGGQLLDSTVNVNLSKDGTPSYSFKQIFWYDSLNNLIADSTYEFNTHGDVDKGEKTTHSYNTNGRLDLSLTQSNYYNNANSGSLSRISRSYNSFGLFTWYQLDKKNGGSWVTDVKYTVDYSPTGKLTRRITEYAGSSSNDTLYVTYDSNDSIVSWLGDGILGGSDSYFYSYGPNGRIDSIISPKDTLSISYTPNNLVSKTISRNNWLNTTTKLYSYDNAGKITKIITNNGSTTDSSLYIYGSNGKLAERYSFYEDRLTQDWKITYEYDNAERLTTANTYGYDTLINSFFFDGSEEYKYNTAGNIISYLYDEDNLTLLYYSGDPSLTTIKTNPVHTPLVYPNPATSKLNVSNTNYTSFHIYSLTGQLLLAFAPNSSIDISQLATGLYVYKIVGDNVFEGKFIKE